MKYCLDCGFAGQPEQHKPGTFQIELGLWLFLLVPQFIYSIGRLAGRYIPGTFLMEDGLWSLFLVPGVVYSIWRLAARHRGCAKCGSRRIVPADSPVAQAALRRLSPSSSLSSWVCMACGEPIFRGNSFCERCETRSDRTSKGVALLRI